MYIRHSKVVEFAKLRPITSNVTRSLWALRTRRKLG